jgi:hypothetical protein
MDRTARRRITDDPHKSLPLAEPSSPSHLPVQSYGFALGTPVERVQVERCALKCGVVGSSSSYLVGKAACVEAR